MKRQFCDKCGEEIYYFPMQNAIIPTYSIQKVEIPFSLDNTVDLCTRCTKDFTTWLNTPPKQAEEAEANDPR
jgi:hypothetical protein